MENYGICSSGNQSIRSVLVAVAKRKALFFQNEAQPPLMTFREVKLCSWKLLESTIWLVNNPHQKWALVKRKRIKVKTLTLSKETKQIAFFSSHRIHTHTHTHMHTHTNTTCRKFSQDVSTILWSWYSKKSYQHLTQLLEAVEDKRTWRALVHGVTKSRTRLND